MCDVEDHKILGMRRQIFSPMGFPRCHYLPYGIRAVKSRDKQVHATNIAESKIWKSGKKFEN